MKEYEIGGTYSKYDEEKNIPFLRLRFRCGGLNFKSRDKHVVTG
jgi:hypothetical protein